ncbi:DUF4062 domain-containing protein [Duganella sp. FT3S]|uniref:DUF4062 domain-containing protein n=1 Tax=Rugamonas fusca TaxID=2758568 RepID=A0A7W2EDX4_9BURK|nr:DUF4062 domain-containing protein [Rugamonas fusca]MBA5604124.1 DUF4062 domain-containing protein [Rugamonas fusca]
MANLRVFLSSTCYDLSVVRGQLRQFVESLGHEPVMSDYNDVVYDPRTHTHTSCIDEVAGADAVVVIIGSRFGGRVVPQALQKVDLESLKSVSKSHEILKTKENLSITQLEVLKAIESSIPLFVFVDDRVMHDHATYEKNKSKAIASEIEFDSIDKPETARYIFEFINFLRLRSTNNGITTFSRLQDIEDSLRKQWSGLLQRLLYEQRARAIDSRRIDSLTDQFEGLKTAILTALGGSKDQKEVARGVVRFRKLIDFVSALRGGGEALIGPSMKWPALLEKLGIREVIEFASEMTNLDRPGLRRPTSILSTTDGSIYEVDRVFDIGEMETEWDEFMNIGEESRRVIVEALKEMGPSGRRMVREFKMPLEEYIQARMEGKQDIPKWVRNLTSDFKFPIDPNQ